ncbi:MAG: ribonuclease [Patescibacteria group bacterium]|nr:ribonuclease [Patescibacteria group bacterium]
MKKLWYNFLMDSSKTYDYVIGVDEAGRGPLAGPVTLGAFGVKVSDLAEIEQLLFPQGIKDSKKLTPKRRELIFDQLVIWHKEGKVVMSHSHGPASDIDNLGIVPTIKLALKKALLPFATEGSGVLVLLDGALRAPSVFVHQKTIIRGDETETVIALASVIAKVVRDRHMVAEHDKYPAYNFAGHKGYGTKVHIEALRQHGICEIHRRSFLTKLDLNKKS